MRRDRKHSEAVRGLLSCVLRRYSGFVIEVSGKQEKEHNACDQQSPSARDGWKTSLDGREAEAFITFFHPQRDGFRVVNSYVYDHAASPCAGVLNAKLVDGSLQAVTAPVLQEVVEVVGGGGVAKGGRLAGSPPVAMLEKTGWLGVPPGSFSTQNRDSRQASATMRCRR